MIINKTGQIVECFYSIGHPAIPIFLMDGVRPLIFDAGFTILGEIYAREIQKILSTFPKSPPSNPRSQNASSNKEK